MRSVTDAAEANAAADDSRGGSSPLAMTYALLRLMRLPTVFTALSNVLCGYLVTQELTANQLPFQSDLLLLLIASAGLYLGGMVLNDVCDAAVDALERPERPIPSGHISRRLAAVTACLLMLTGILAAMAAGPASLAISLLLLIMVAAYDVRLKNTWFGPLAMGTCRFLNVLLGGSAAGWPAIQQLPLPGIAVALLVYIVGVTWFARNEAGTSSRRTLLAGVALVMSGLALDAAVVAHSADSDAGRQGGWVGLFLILVHLLARTGMAVKDPQPRRIQQTVGLLLLSIIFIDATLVFALTGDGGLAAVVVLLIVPARLLRRFLPLS